MNKIQQQYTDYRNDLKESYGSKDVEEQTEGKEFKKLWLEIESEK